LKKTLEAQRAVNRESVIRKFFVWDDKDEGKPGNEQQTDNVSEKTTNVKRSKKRKSRPSRKKKMQEVSGRLPWVVPFKDGHAPQRPWLDLIQQPSRQKGDARSILGNELLGLMTFLRPSSTEQDAVNHIIDDLSYKLQGIVPNPPELIGSRHAELATSISTIDLMILVDDDPIHNTSKDKPPAITPDMKYNYLEMLTQAEDVLKKDFGYRDCQVLFYKSSSLLFFHRASGLPVKLFCRNYPSKLEEFIRDSLRELPSLMPLCLIMRVFLESKSLFGWEAESLNSNALCLLIMAFLKQQPRDFTSKSLGEQLLSLLYTYGKQIDITTTCISASPAEFFTRSTILKQERSFIKDNMTIPDYLRGQRAILNYKLHAKHKGNTGVASHLCIQDPTNYLVDVGLRSFRTPELQRTFSGLYDDLKLALERWDEGHRDDDTILGQVLRADFRVLLRMKRRLTM
jgi:DNA polymerase sigma